MLEGGEGGKERRRFDLHMVERALRHRWPIKRKTRRAAVERVEQILSDPKASNRDIIAAVKVLGYLDAQNEPLPQTVVNVHQKSTFEAIRKDRAMTEHELQLIDRILDDSKRQN